MWSYEHSIESGAASEAIWALWADVENWGVWNTDIAEIEVSGPLAAGTKIAMTPAGQDPVHLEVAEAVAGEMFVDEARVEGLVIRTTHRLDRLDRLDGQRTRVTYRMEITGEAADQVGPHLGPAITSDWPEVMAALVKLALSEKAQG